MAKRQRPPAVFSDYESFIYLITELELVIGKGAIQWSAATANIAERRLEKMATAMRQIVRTIENE